MNQKIKNKRRWWTTKELSLAKFYANEGLSVTRTAPLIGRSRGELAAAASRYKIRFKDWEDNGAPLGNSNRKGKGIGWRNEKADPNF